MGKAVPAATGVLLLILPFLALAAPCRGSDHPRINPTRQWGHCVRQTGDGGFIITGNTWRCGIMCSNICLLKTDGQGNRVWARYFGGNNVAWGYAVHQTKDEGYIVAGTSWPSASGMSHICLIKTDKQGNKVWAKDFGGRGRYYAYAVAQARDGGYIVAGKTDLAARGEYDVFVLKTDESGTTTWTRTFGGKHGDCAYAVQQTKDGGYIFGETTQSFRATHSNAYLIKTDGRGKALWTSTLGRGHRDWGRSVQETADGGFILAGSTWPVAGRYSDCSLIKTDPLGNRVWHRTFGGPYGDHAYEVQQTLDRGYIIVGNTWPFGDLGGSDILLLKTDGQGRKTWEKTWGGDGDDFGYSLQETREGNYIVTGKSNSHASRKHKIYLFMADPRGDKIWEKTLG